MILRSVLSNWMAIAVNGVITFVLTPILISSLGDFYFGMWVLVMSILGYYGLFDVGIRTTLHRFVGWFRGRNERIALNKIISSALAIGCGIGILLAGITLALTIVLPHFFDIQQSNQYVFRMLILLLGLSASVVFPAGILGAYLIGLQRFDLYNLAAIATSVVRAALIIAVLHTGFGVLGVAAVTLTAGLLSLFLNWRLVWWADPQISVRWRHISWTQIRDLGNYSFYVFVISLGNYLRFHLDSIVIAQLLGIPLVTPYSVAARIMRYFAQVSSGLVGPFMPRTSELEGKSSQAELRELFLHGTKATAFLSLFIGSLLLLDGQTLLRLWLGERFVAVYPLLVILTAGYVVGLGQGPSTVVIYAKNRHRPWAFITLAEGVANLLLSIYLARKYGLVGVALGTAVPMLAVGLLAKPWYALRLVGISAQVYVRDALARPIVTGILFLGVCYLTSGEHIPTSIGTFAVALAWQSSLFASLAYAVGLTGSERQIVLQRCRYITGSVVRIARSYGG